MMQISRREASSQSQSLLLLFSVDGVTGEESFCAFANLMILPAFISPVEDVASRKILDFFFFTDSTVWKMLFASLFPSALCS